MVKVPALSLLWHGFDPLPRNFQRHGHGKKEGRKKERRKEKCYFPLKQQLQIFHLYKFHKLQFLHRSTHPRLDRSLSMYVLCSICNRTLHKMPVWGNSLKSCSKSWNSTWSILQPLKRMKCMSVCLLTKMSMYI